MELKRAPELMAAVLVGLSVWGCQAAPTEARGNAPTGERRLAAAGEPDAAELPEGLPEELSEADAATKLVEIDPAQVTESAPAYGLQLFGWGTDYRRGYAPGFRERYRSYRYLPIGSDLFGASLFGRYYDEDRIVSRGRYYFPYFRADDRTYRRYRSSYSPFFRRYDDRTLVPFFRFNW